MLAIVAAVIFVPKISLAVTDENALYAEAEQQLEAGHPDEAWLSVNRLLEKQPGWSEANLLLARIEIARWNAEAAINALDRAVAEGMPGERIHAHLGAARMQLGDYDGADEALHARIVEQDLGLANRLLAQLAARRGDMAQTRKLLDLSRKFDAENALLWADYALYYDRADQRLQARQALARARKLDPESLDVLSVAGRLTGKWAGPTAALAYYERALERAPDDLGLLAAKAKALAEAGRHWDMLETAYHMLDISPRDAGAHYLLAWLAARADEQQLAEHMLDRAEGMMGDSPAFLLLAGINQYEQGDFYAATDRFRDLADREPDNARAAKLLALSYLKDGNAASAYRAIAPFAEGPRSDVYSQRLAALAQRKAGLD